MTKLNKRLATILAGLVGLYILIIAFHAARRESNIQTVTFHVDTTGATEIDLYPHIDGRREIKLVRHSGQWRLKSGTIDVAPIVGSAENLLNTLVNIAVQRLVSRRKDEWDKYQVGDTSGTRIVVYKGTHPIADYYIGNGPSGEGGFYGSGLSFIRQNGHNEVYAIDGYWHGMVDKLPADWRDKTVLRLNSADVSGISFQGNPGFVLSKRDSSWWLAQSRVRTDSVNRYLTRLQSYNLNQFADNFNSPGSPDRSIIFNGASSPLATVKAWKQSGGSWVVNSSQNGDSYFTVSDSVMNGELWCKPDAWAR